MLHPLASFLHTHSHTHTHELTPRGFQSDSQMKCKQTRRAYEFCLCNLTPHMNDMGGGSNYLKCNRQCGTWMTNCHWSQVRSTLFRSVPFNYLHSSSAAARKKCRKTKQNANIRAGQERMARTRSTPKKINSTFGKKLYYKDIIFINAVLWYMVYY